MISSISESEWPNSLSTVTRLSRKLLKVFQVSISEMYRCSIYQYNWPLSGHSCDALVPFRSHQTLVELQV